VYLQWRVNSHDLYRDGVLVRPSSSGGVILISRLTPGFPHLSIRTGRGLRRARQMAPLWSHQQLTTLRWPQSSDVCDYSVESSYTTHSRCRKNPYIVFITEGPYRTEKYPETLEMYSLLFKEKILPSRKRYNVTHENHSDIAPSLLKPLLFCLRHLFYGTRLRDRNSRQLFQKNATFLLKDFILKQNIH